jgi:AraC-like DNA-binding protein
MPKRQQPKPVKVTKSDAFVEAVGLARLRGELVTSAELDVGEHVAFSPAAAYFQYLEGAPCLLRIGGTRRKLDLHDGDLVFLLRGDAHRIERKYDEAAPTRITTGTFRVESAHADAITSALPQCLHVPQLNRLVSSPPASPEQWLAVTLAAMRLEVDRPTLGSALMLSRLIDLLFVWAIRHWLASAPEQTHGWIAALQDPVLGEALALMHAEPARDWNVNILAGCLHRSRSSFSKRFIDVVGEPPIRYLTRWRMRLAADLLASSNLRVSQVAQRVGYGSVAAFSRAFKRQFGVAPVDYRSTSRLRPQVPSLGSNAISALGRKCRPANRGS